MIYLLITFVGLFVIGMLTWYSARQRERSRRFNRGNPEAHNRLMNEAAAMSRDTDPTV